MTADRDLLFGLLALQVGLIDQGQLVAAFQAWTRDRGRSLADHLADRGDLDDEQRTVVEAMVALHLKAHGGDAERSLASMSVGRSTRDRLTSLGDPELSATVAGLRSDPTATDRTVTYGAGAATADRRRFRVLRPHARGGLGAVFVAMDEELHREVALKQILDDLADDPGSRARFVVEAEITGGLEHPGIVPVYGLGLHGDGRPYYAMRFVRGGSLKEAIRAFRDDAATTDPGRRSLGLRKLLRRFVDVCNTIDYAHSRGVIHRDLKPSNVIVGAHGETLVIDWGLAKPLGRSGSDSAERTLRPASAGGSAETAPGSALGTPAFMSPEAAAGDLDRVGPRSDVYGLGATLYCLLTGRPPFEGDDVGAVLRRVAAGDFPAPRRLDPTIDADIEAVCLMAMAREPADRYPTARALADDVERWAADEPVTARPEPIGRRARRWSRRHRSAMTGAAAAVAAGVVGLVAVVVVQDRANAALAGSLRRESAANAALAEARDAERARFDLAVEAIRTFHTGVSEDLLLKEEPFRDLRHRLLGGAVGFYQKLETALADEPDARSRRALGRAYAEVGALTEQIGTVPEALAMHRKALAVRRSLARAPDADPETRADVGRSLIAIGRLLDAQGKVEEAVATLVEAGALLGAIDADGAADDAIRVEAARATYHLGAVHLHTGALDDALAAYGRSRSVLESLAEPVRRGPEVRRLLAWCENDTGGVYIRRGEWGLALDANRRARRMKAELARDDPDDPELRRDLASADMNIGVLLTWSGHVEDAIPEIARARATLEELVRGYPAVFAFRSDLGKVSDNLGYLLTLVGRTAEAAEPLERAAGLFRGLVEERPSVPDSWCSLGNNAMNRAHLAEKAGDPAAALPLFEEARALFERVGRDHPEVASDPEYTYWLGEDLAGLGRCFYRAGRDAEAAAPLRRSIAIRDGLPALDADTRLDQARSHALLAALAGRPGTGVAAVEGPAERDLALECLRRAVAEGLE